MYTRLIQYIVRNLSLIIRFIGFGIMFLYGLLQLARDWYFFIKYYKIKIRLFQRHPNGIICNGKHYKPNGLVSDELPRDVPILNEDEIPNLERILKTNEPAFDYDNFYYPT